MRLDRYKTHDIEVVIDRIIVNDASEKRLEEAIKTALYTGNNILMVIDIDDDHDDNHHGEVIIGVLTFN